jgi:uroporphyrinogen-III synthase
VSDPPLAGLTVVVTRPGDQAESLAQPLEGLGATVLRVPTIEIVPTPIDDEWRRAASGLATRDLVVFTSANAVRWFVDRLPEVGVSADRDDLATVELAAIGPATVAALNERGLAAAVVPDEFVAEALVDELTRRGRSLEGARVLVPGARDARRVLPDGLRERGAAVDVLTVYDTAPAAALSVSRAEVEAADYVTFTSGSTVDAFVELMDPDDLPRRLASVRLCSIGPVTSAALKRHGLAIAVEAGAYSSGGLVTAVVADAQARRHLP